MIKNYFLLDKKKYGKKLIMLCRTSEGVFRYDHDEMYNKHINHLYSLPCWNEYGRYTKTYGIPHVMSSDCTKII